MRVIHPEFGLGQIVAIEGEGSGRKGRVAFAVGPARTFVLAKSPLRPMVMPTPAGCPTAGSRRSEPSVNVREPLSHLCGERTIMPRLGVNIDHVATLRQVRGGREPDPVWAAVLAELGGADVITIHLREDRRHIQERDLRLLRQTVQVRLNLELAVEPGVIALALEVKPDQATFVPERREELTTEGGLDVAGQRDRVAEALARCRDAGIDVALFIDPDPRQVEAAVKLGATAVELHTGRYANAPEGPDRSRELDALKAAAVTALTSGLELHAGHGLNYQNVAAVARLDRMEELNIGHSIISRAVFVGLTQAVREMKACIDLACCPPVFACIDERECPA